MVELLITMSLLTLIVLALMAVFNSTQRAFRASVTQTDILEGSRATVDLITSDLRSLVPSYGLSNNAIGFIVNNRGAVNFFATNNFYQYAPLPQTLPGSSVRRTNVLEYFFMLGRENTKWKGAGYVVDASSSSPLYPLYRYYSEMNIRGNPFGLYTNFLATIYSLQFTNLSHVMNGVVHLTVRGFDSGGYVMTNTYVYGGGITGTNLAAIHDNVYFAAYATQGEVSFYSYSNAVPAAVELQLGVLEDRTLARAESLGIPGQAPVNVPAQWNYLQNQAGHVHLFRQRVSIPNVDPTAFK